MQECYYEHIGVGGVGGRRQKELLEDEGKKERRREGELRVGKCEFLFISFLFV